MIQNAEYDHLQKVKTKGILSYHIQFISTNSGKHSVTQKHHSVILPESLHCTVWTLQSSREQLHSCILQVIVRQVQVSQT